MNASRAIKRPHPLMAALARADPDPWRRLSYARMLTFWNDHTRQDDVLPSQAQKNRNFHFAMFRGNLKAALAGPFWDDEAPKDMGGYFFPALSFLWRLLPRLKESIGAQVLVNL